MSVIAPDQRLYSHLKSHKPISYSVIKHGLIGLTKYLASYLARYNIRVNAIAPGFIETDMVRSLPLDKYEEWLKSIKMKRNENIKK